MQMRVDLVAHALGTAISCVTLLAMKIAPLAALLCVLPLAGCYVVQYPGGALTFSQDPNAPQALRAAPGSVGAAGDVSTAPVPTPTVSAAPMQAQPAPSVSMPPPPPGKSARQAYPNGPSVPPDYRPGNRATPVVYPNGSPVPPDYRPSPQSAPVYPNGSPVPPDYVPPQSQQMPSGGPVYTTYPAYSAYPTYATYPTYAPYPAYAEYPNYAPFYPGFAPSPWLSNVSLSFSWGRGWGGGWGGHCCRRWH